MFTELELAESWVETNLGRGYFDKVGEPAPEAWAEWVSTMFARYVTHPFSDRHEEMWDWGWSLSVGQSTEPFIAIWPRGGGKTTSAELLATALGLTNRRRYVWFISETQLKADNNIRNIGALLESSTVAKHYPLHAERMLTKYGHSKGWTSSRLRTAGGFTVDAIGLDTAQRGLKVEEQRPDLIILDDVDGKHDSLQTTSKKIATITTSILPAGSTDAAVLCVQNLIIPNGFFTRMVDGRADYLARRHVSGPHPAIHDLEWEWQDTPDGQRLPVITRGTASWAGQSLEVCQGMMERFGPVAFLKECQHRVKDLAQGLVVRFDRTAHMQEWSEEDLIEGLQAGKLKPFAGIDYGHWRFAFLLFVSDRAGRVHVIEELFSQREELSVRAKKIDQILRKYGIESLNVYGDPANPTDAMEMNKALDRGWKRGDEEYRPRWRVSAAIKDKGSRTTGPDRINDMLVRRQLLVRRGIGNSSIWFMGKTTGTEGDPIRGSRFLWEMDNWLYEDPMEGRAQTSKPDDDSADGADMMAAFRYAIMSNLKATSFEVPAKPRNPNRDERFDKMKQRLTDEMRRRAG